MSRSAKLSPLSPNPKPGGMEDMRAYGERVQDFLLKLREDKTLTPKLKAQVDYFIEHDQSPPETN